MVEYRITKYDPALRDARGACTQDDWTSFGDIGRSFGGRILTLEEYRRIEDAYVAVAIAFLREAGVATLTVSGLEDRTARSPFAEGDVVRLAELAEAARHVLREEFWCRFEGARAFLHFGYDFYMYVGVPQACPKAEKESSRLGLFVEAFLSPYRERISSEPG